MCFGSFVTLRFQIVIAALLGLSAAGNVVADPGVSDTQIVIGQSIALEGGKNSYGLAAAEGAKLYFDMVNAAGGVHGRKIVLDVLDDNNKAADAEANARKLIANGVFILFGSIEGGPSTGVMKAANELRVPFFGPMAGSPTLRRPFSPYVFPVRAEHRDEFRALMTWGKRIGLKTVGFLHAESDVGLSHLENVKLIAAELGLTVNAAIPLKNAPSDADIDAMVKAIGEKKPDIFFNHGSGSVYQKIIAKAKAARLTTNFMGVNSGSTQIAKGLGELASGIVFAQVVPNPLERKHLISREFQDAALKADFRQGLSYGALEGFLTAKVLVLGLKGSGRDLTRAGLVRTLEAANFELGGVTLSYSPKTHEGSRFVDLSMVSRDGRFVH